MERIGIFAFYDKNGIAEDYVSYLLRDLRQSLSRLVIVCNGSLTEESRHIFMKYADNIFIRENKGYDIGAFKECMISFLGWDEIEKYDELILCNDTFFGPFIPFEHIFANMEKRNVDFWGLSAQPDSIDFWEGTDRIVPAFIQSFFMAVESKMLHSNKFRKYWENLDVLNLNVTQVVVQHEQYFTCYFEKAGFSWDVFINMNIFSPDPMENNYTAYLRYPYELIKYGSCPFIKKKCFTGNDISKNKMPDNGSIRKALAYIENKTSYNGQYILDYLMAKGIDQSFYRICSGKIEKLENQDLKMRDKVVLLLVRISSSITAKLIYTYLLRICDIVSCYVFCKEEIKDLLILDRETECIHFLKEHFFEEYVKDIQAHFKQKIDYIGVIRDRKDECMIEPACTWISYHRMLCENMIADREHVKEIINCFENDAKLGILTVPRERFSSFLYDHEEDSCDGYWYRYQETKPNKEYYKGKVFKAKYAGLILINEVKIITDIFKDSMSDTEITDYASFLEQNLIAFCRRHAKLFIYGSGGVGIRTAHAFQKKGICFEGFVVSDGQNKEQVILGHKVYWLSELTNDTHNTGFVIAVEKHLYGAITQNLYAHHIDHFKYSCY